MNTVFGYSSVADEIQAMYNCAYVERWNDLWRIWRGFPVAMRRRPPEVYHAIFQCTALRQHQAEAMRCLRECVAEMEVEEPPVEIDATMAKSIRACLLVAAPNAATEAADKDSFGEWARLWRRCDHLRHDPSLEPS